MGDGNGTTGIPPLAGLATYREAARTGATVDDAVRMLRRLGRIEKRMLLVLAAHIPAVPEWEVKCALALHLWQDAEHAAAMRHRVTEMRKPPHFFDRVDDSALEDFFEELLRSRSTRELLTGVYSVLKPGLVEAAEDYMSEASPLADQPTFRVLKLALVEEREQIAWGEQALAALGGPDEDWREHLQAYMSAGGGAGGKGEREVSLPEPRGTEPFELVRVPHRDDRFTRIWNSRGESPTLESSTDELVWRMFYVRLGEMELTELLALTLYEWPDLSFEMLREIARHLWDETRHSMLGETAFVDRGADWHTVPFPISLASFPNTELEPRERYALVWGIEHPLMRRASASQTTAGVIASKPGQYDLAAASGDPLSALIQDFDWADEVLHVQIGRRVLEQAFATHEERDAAASDANDRWQALLREDMALERSAWWDEFYATVRQ